MLQGFAAVNKRLSNRGVLTGACRTLDAKRADDIVPKSYQIGTKVCTFFISRGGSMENVKTQICTLNLEKCTDLVGFLVAHTNR